MINIIETNDMRKSIVCKQFIVTMHLLGEISVNSITCLY